MTATTNIKEINGDNFNLTKEKAAIIVFTANWCNSCHNMIDMLSSTSDIPVPVYNCDVDQNEQLADDVHITNLPVVAIIHNGKIVDKMNGMQNISNIMESINSYIY